MSKRTVHSRIQKAVEKVERARDIAEHAIDTESRFSYIDGDTLETIFSNLVSALIDLEAAKGGER